MKEIEEAVEQLLEELDLERSEEIEETAKQVATLRD
jgi:hypothetical protein